MKSSLGGRDYPRLGSETLNTKIGLSSDDIIGSHCSEAGQTTSPPSATLAESRAIFCPRRALSLTQFILVTKVKASNGLRHFSRGQVWENFPQMGESG